MPRGAFIRRQDSNGPPPARFAATNFVASSTMSVSGDSVIPNHVPAAEPAATKRPSFDPQVAA